MKTWGGSVFRNTRYHLIVLQFHYVGKAIETVRVYSPHIDTAVLQVRDKSGLEKHYLLGNVLLEWMARV